MEIEHGAAAPGLTALLQAWSLGDASALAAQCDGVIFVIRVGKTAHDVLRHVVDQVDAVKGRILGVVLNRADPRRDGYYHYYQAYQRYYGADEGSAKR